MYEISRKIYLYRYRAHEAGNESKYRLQTGYREFWGVMGML